MSKYLIAIVSSRNASNLQRLLGVSAWTSARTCRSWTIFVHTDAADEHVGGGRSLFKGWYIDHARERLVFSDPGNDDRPSPDRPVEGCYIATRLSGNVLTVGNDLFCQLPLLHFCDRDIFVASDSMFALSEVRKAVGLPCRLNEQVARARAWTRSLGLQNQSDQTLLADVAYNGVGTWLDVDLSGDALRCDVHRTDVADLFQVRHTSYDEALRDAAVKLGRHVASLAAAGGTVACSVSGGQDSRAVAAAASLVAPATGTVYAISQENLSEEFSVASSLIGMAGLPYRPRRRPQVEQQGTALSRWLMHSAGIYDRLISSTDRDPAEGVLPVGGYGGELSKGMWRWWRIPWLIYASPLRSQAALRAECERGLRAMGVSLRQRWSAELHYLGYRNAIHGGRTAANYLFAGSPLMQRSLIGLAYSKLNDLRPARRGAPSIVTDLTIVLRPDMAAHPYRRRAAAISNHYVQQRLRQLGGPIDKRALAPYEVVGDPRSAAIRSSSVFGERAAGVEEAAANGSQRLIDLALAGGRRCPDEARDLYDPMIRRLRSIPNDAKHKPRENAYAAKLIALNLLD
jgi:hypothetical protein